jgi:hypothetical protein
MPNLQIHCDISKRRTGQTYEELHKWMDEATEYLGANHRLERHFFTSEYKEFISRKWGAKAVVEWLFHIAIDNLETANKFAVEEYNKPFEEIDIKFEGKYISQCNFLKTSSNGNKKTFEISVNGKDDINRVVREKVVKEEPKPKKKFYRFKRRSF